MPLQTRIVEPLYVTRNTVWQGTSSPDDNELSYGAAGSMPNELESVANGTCANIIRQLSSLSKHAEDMFGELARQSNSLVARVNLLKIRFARLSAGVGRLDSSDEGVSLIKTKKVFKSNVVFDQKIFSRNNMPASMREMYSRCDEPPPLYKLNPFRDDGMDCMKFYTDPNFFFELWKSDTLKASEKILRDRERKLHRPKSQILEDCSGSHNKHTIKQINNNIKELQKKLSTQPGKFITATDDSHYDIANYQVKLIESRQFSHCMPQFNNHQAGNSMVNKHIITESPSTDIILSNDYATPFGSDITCDKSNEYNYCRTQSSNNYQYAIGTSPTTTVFNPLGTPSRKDKVRPLAPQRFDSLTRPPSSTKTQALANHRFRFNYTTLSPSPSQIKDDLYFMKYLSTPPPPPSRTQHVPINPSLPSKNVPPPPPLPPMTDQLATIANNGVNSHSKQKISSIVQSNPADTNINNITFRNTTGINHTAHYSTHTEFLKMIKGGVVLRKVETNKEKEINTVSDDVISILARRLAVEISDSDSSSNQGDDSDSWTDDGETYRSPTVSSNNIRTNNLSLDSNLASLPPPPSPPSLIENNLAFTESFLPPPPSPPPYLIENNLAFTEPFPSPPPSPPLVSISPPSPLETSLPPPPLSLMNN